MKRKREKYEAVLRANHAELTLITRKILNQRRRLSTLALPFYHSCIVVIYPKLKARTTSLYL